MLTTLLMLVSLSAATPMPETTGHVEGQFTTDYALDYLVQTPADYDPDGDPIPLVFFLHGAGERGDDLEQVKLFGPPKLAAQGKSIDAIIVSPQCPKDQWWPLQVPGLIAVLDKVEADYHIDTDRVYVTGLSMGGFGTFALGAAIPDRITAIVPICGGGDFLQANNLTRMPAWVFHGGADPVVPVDESKRMVKMMNARDGENAKLTVYPGVNHNSWTRAYADEAMWDWLFSQRLSDRAAE